MVSFLSEHLTRQDKKEIVDAIIRAESMTSGEIRVHLQKKCKAHVMQEAEKVFHRLNMHKTKHRNGVLILIALENKQFAILGDRAIHNFVGSSYWDQARDKMLFYFSQGKLKEGIIEGVLSVGQKLKDHFPARSGDTNELANDISEDN